MLTGDLHKPNKDMKDTLSSVAASLVWYVLVFFFLTGLLCASLACFILSIAAGIVVGVPVLLGWLVARLLRPRCEQNPSARTPFPTK